MQPYSTTQIGPHVGLIFTHVWLIVTRVGSARLFDYQRVGIGNAKSSHFGSLNQHEAPMHMCSCSSGI